MSTAFVSRQQSESELSAVPSTPTRKTGISTSSPSSKPRYMSPSAQASPVTPHHVSFLNPSSPSISTPTRTPLNPNIISATPRILQEQAQREGEFKQQATEAEALLARARQTRITAELEAKSAIQETKRMLLALARERDKTGAVRRAEEHLAQITSERDLWISRRGEELKRLAVKAEQLRDRESALRKELIDMQGLEQEWMSTEKGQQEHLAKLQTELQGVRAQEQLLQQGIAREHNQSTLARLEQEIVEAQNRFQEAQSKAQEARTGIERARLALESARADATRQQAILEELRQEQSHLEAALSHASKTLDQARVDRDQAKAREQELLRQLGEQRDQLSKVTQELTLAGNQETQARRVLDNVNQTWQETRARSAPLLDRIDTLEQESLRIDQQIKQLQERKRIVEDEIDKTKVQSEPLLREIDELDGLRVTASSKFQDARSLLDTAQGNVNAVKRHLAVLEQEAGESRSKVAMVEDTLARNSSIERDARARLEAMVQKPSQQESIVQAAMAEVQAAEQRLHEALSKGSQFDFQHWAEQVRARQASLDAYKSRLNQMHLELEHCEQRARQLQAQHSAMHARLDEARHYWQAQSPRYARLRDALDSLVKELDNLDKNARIWTQDPVMLWGARVSDAEAERDAAMERFLATLRANPPSDLAAQLAREGEAVLRAEAALAMERRQETLVREAEGLASWHVIDKPIKLDSLAQSSLLTRHHLQTPPRYYLARDADQENKDALFSPSIAPSQEETKQVAQEVLKLAESRHIKSGGGEEASEIYSSSSYNNKQPLSLQTSFKTTTAY